jgi:hypothetical protein
MAFVLLSGWNTLSNDVTPQEALSGIFGSISLATWIFLLVSCGVFLRIYWIPGTVLMSARSLNSF